MGRIVSQTSLSSWSRSDLPPSPKNLAVFHPCLSCHLILAIKKAKGLLFGYEKRTVCGIWFYLLTAFLKIQTSSTQGVKGERSPPSTCCQCSAYWPSLPQRCISGTWSTYLPRAPDRSIQSTFPASHSQAVLLREIILSQRQNFSFFVVELREVSIRPLASPSLSEWRHNHLVSQPLLPV